MVVEVEPKIPNQEIKVFVTLSNKKYPAERNVVLPETALEFNVKNSQQSQFEYVFTKIDPRQGWGKIDIEVRETREKIVAENRDEDEETYYEDYLQWIFKKMTNDRDKRRRE